MLISSGVPPWAKTALTISRWQETAYVYKYAVMLFLLFF
jgi:hypothetical protein